ncbi:MAG TPA: bifunctional riboflavin kinase/FAD synthetase [Actinobacteria bacterium]|nr:bifunctional riboflavin kinase/FAD synthetase [Actinomycetota bacterium]
MRIIEGAENLSFQTKTVATIGTFDGVHIGHRLIIEEVIARAKQTKLPSLLMTFDQHPRQVLASQPKIKTLMSLDEKLAYLVNFDLDYVCVLPFRKIAKLSAQDFYETILLAKANVGHLYIGANFKFGSGASGDIEWLRKHSDENFEVTEVALERVDETVASSTKIRELLMDGKIDDIPQLLGRNMTLTGRVVRGAGRGGGLGFPTANLEFDAELCLPGTGIYAGYLWIDDRSVSAVINCGYSPTFGENSFQCEAHALDYHADLYGSRVKLELATRLRDEQKFPSPEALSRQITHDVHVARQWFKHHKPSG